MDTRLWITSAKPGDIVTIGLVVIRVIQSKAGKLVLHIEAPDSQKIIKRRRVVRGA